MDLLICQLSVGFVGFVIAHVLAVLFINLQLYIINLFSNSRIYCVMSFAEIHINQLFFAFTSHDFMSSKT